MKMKKWMAMALAGMLCVGMLAGCGSSETSAKTDDTSDASAASVDYDGKITILTATKDEFLTVMDQAAQGYAEACGCEYTSIDCGDSFDQQLEYAKAAVADGTDALIISLATSDNSRASDIIEAAGDVPVVFVNRELADNSVLDETHVYVGSDEDICGQYVGELLADYCKEAGKDSVNYLMFQGTAGQTSTTKRSEGALNGLKEAGITATAVADPIDCGYSRSTAMEQMTNLLSNGLDMSTVDLIISNNDAMALGAIEACKQNDVDLSNIAIVGTDGMPDAIKAIQDGQMIGTVYQNATEQGAVSVQVAINLASSKDAWDGVTYETAKDNEYIVDIPFEKIDASNVDQFS